MTSILTVLNFNKSKTASFCANHRLKVTYSHFVLALSGPNQPWGIHSSLKVQSHWLLWWWEGFEKQVSSQAWGYGSLGNALLEVRKSVSDTGVILEMEEDVLLDQAPHPNLLLGPPSALQFTAGQHGIPVWFHLGPDLWDALTGVWGGAHHLKRELGGGGVGVAGCMYEFKASLFSTTRRQSGPFNYSAFQTLFSMIYMDLSHI